MSRFRFELATRADDVQLRHVLAATPMPGRISVRFEREPSYFDAAVVDGRFRQVVVAREHPAQRIIGFGARSIHRLHVNGEPQPVGYLGSLRCLQEYRGLGLLARGYEYLEELHADGRARLYLTTIAEDNQPALALLTSRRAGLPAYHFAGHLHTLAIPPRRRVRRAAANLEIREASRSDAEELVEFLNRHGPSRQFFPCYETGDFFQPRALFRDLDPGDLLLARRDGRLVGSLGGWDQSAYRQTVIEGYAGLLRWVRPAYNGWAVLRRRPGLPGRGEELRSLVAALPVVAGDDRAVFAALLEHLVDREHGSRNRYVMVGLHESDPLLPVAETFRSVSYITRLYVVCWGDGEVDRARLDRRPPYLELGCL